MASVNIIFQPGDQVQVAPPPPPTPEPVMTVIAVGAVNLLTGTSIECEWYANGQRNSSWFKASDLHLVIPAALPKAGS